MLMEAVFALQFRMNDTGTLEVVSDKKVGGTEPLAEVAAVSEEPADKRPARKAIKPCAYEQISPSPEHQSKGNFSRDLV